MVLTHISLPISTLTFKMNNNDIASGALEAFNECRMIDENASFRFLETKDLGMSFQEDILSMIKFFY
jgi:hypothetical protein